MDETMKGFLNVAEQSLRAGMDTGMEVERRRHFAALRALQTEFQQALLDPESRIKTSLEIAILGVLSPLEQADNAYAVAGVKRDQLARHDGRDDHDMTTRGAPLRGSA